ncbi:MAG: iron ABC transporter permease [Alphaproteobacteria bacterium]|nr:iron ABC transporter permease [Alphaproteobacteria bacterium]
MKPFLIPGLILACVLAGLAGLFAGDARIGFSDLLALGSETPELSTLILSELRLPRTLLGLLIGAGLGASGAVLQGYFRNPLADPGIVGVSSSAGLGAVLALYFGWATVFGFAVPIAAVIAAMIGAVLLLLLAGRRAGATTLILAGVAVSAAAGALTALIMNMAPNPWALAEIAYWLMGSLNDASWTELRFAAPLIGSGLILLILCRGGIEALSLGEETALSLGIHLGRLRIIMVAGTALAVGGGVAVAGAIGFIGLVVPHLLRGFVEHRPGLLVLPSALGGAALLSAADTATRLISGPGIPLYLGVLTALIGAPFFLWLIRSLPRSAP